MNKVKAAVCWHCKTPLPMDVGRSTDCPDCQRDSRVCRNCRFYDSHSYNECHESQAERVVDKEKATFCDYFSTSTSKNSAGSAKNKGHKGNKGNGRHTSKSEALRAAEALFK